MPDSSNFDLFTDTDSESGEISPLFGRDITRADRESVAHEPLIEEELISPSISTPYSVPLSQEEAAKELAETARIQRDWQERGKKAAGRPTKLTPDRHKFIIDEIKKGTPDRIACLLSGAHEDSLNQWDQRGKRDIRAGKDTIFSRFSIDVRIAKSELEARLAKKWAKIGTEPTLKRKKVYKEQLVNKPDGSTEIVRYLDSDTIEEVGDGNWQAIAEFMSRRFEGWKKQQTIEQTGPDGGPIQIQQATIDINALSMEARELLLGEIRKKLAELGPSPFQEQEQKD